jgi:phosphoglycolate phosphatase-like HAD superfamily hydrolase
MTLSEYQPGIYLDNSIIDSLTNSDGIIFDCDGVLIDITKSYDLTIDKTTKYVLEKFSNITDAISIDSKIIDGFKSTGGFNDEVDLAYAAIISIFVAKKTKRDQLEFIFEVIKNCDTSGIISTEKYLEKIINFDEIKNHLSYPGTHHDNPLYKIFDQLFYGPEKSKYNSKIGIVTGRGKESVRYSLRNLLEEFDVNNSAFLEDEPRSLAKPNPESLIRSIKAMTIKNSLYVGDSMEDLIMAKKATEQGHKTNFCGIIGTSKNPSQKLDLFEKNGAQLVLDSIELLPKVLNLE